MPNLYIDLDANRFVEDPSSLSPLGQTALFQGDDPTANVYFLKRTGIVDEPFVYEDKSSASFKLAIGNPAALPTSGTWTIDGTSYDYDVTAAELQTGLRTSQSDNSLTVTGSMAEGFTITWGANGAESLLSVDGTQLLPTVDVVVSERRTGTVSIREQQFIRARVTPAVFEDTWTNLSTTVSATITEVQSGSSTVNEIQRIALAVEPVSGEWTITFPSDTRSVTAAVVAGVFTTTTNHGFALDQPITHTGFTAEANFTEGVTYYVKTTPTPTTYTIAATAGGSAITTATADAGSGSVITFARTTAPLDYNATTAEVQEALEALDSIGTSGVSVSGIPSERYQIMFTGQKGLAALPALTAQVGGLLGAYGKTATIDLATFGVADLLAGASSVTATLEAQLSESGQILTVAQQSITLTQELIDDATLGPSGGPSLTITASQISDSTAVGRSMLTAATAQAQADLLPAAGAANAGTVSTGTQTIAGAKTLTGQLQLTGQTAVDSNSALTITTFDDYLMTRQMIVVPYPTTGEAPENATGTGGSRNSQWAHKLSSITPGTSGSASTTYNRHWWETFAPKVNGEVDIWQWSRDQSVSIDYGSNSSCPSTASASVYRVFFGTTGSITTLATTNGVGLEFRFPGSDVVDVYAFAGTGGSVTYSAKLFSLAEQTSAQKQPLTIRANAGALTIYHGATAYATGLTAPSTDTSSAGGYLWIAGISNDSTSVGTHTFLITQYTIR